MTGRSAIGQLERSAAARPDRVLEAAGHAATASITGPSSAGPIGGRNPSSC